MVSPEWPVAEESSRNFLFPGPLMLPPPPTGVPMFTRLSPGQLAGRR